MACFLRTDYPVVDQEITLTIVIGDAQLGSSLVSLDGAKIATGDIDNLGIGKGTSVKGKTLLIKSVVSDVNDKTNHMSVTYKLKGGVKDDSYGLEATVAEEGDSINFRAEIKFV